MRTRLLTMIATATVSGLLALSAAAAETALKDQFGNVVGMERFDEQTLVAIVVSAKRLRRLKKWEVALKEAFPDIDVVRIADIPNTPPTTYERVADVLRRRLPEDLPVLIDLDGTWRQAYGLNTNVPNLLLFDRGTLHGRHAGMYDDEEFRALAESLDGLHAQP